MNPDAIVRRYYEAIDAGEYVTLESLLSPTFVQRRPDRTFDGREEFVRFMRDDRPRTDTSHDVRGVIADGERVAVRGRLLARGDSADSGSDDALFEFVDVFEIDGQRGRIRRLDTYTR